MSLSALRGWWGRGFWGAGGTACANTLWLQEAWRALRTGKKAVVARGRKKGQEAGGGKARPCRVCEPW